MGDTPPLARARNYILLCRYYMYLMIKRVFKTSSPFLYIKEYRVKNASAVRILSTGELEK